MTLKETNTILINRLRVINKYDADFNLVLNYLWPHTTISKTEKEGLLGDNQRSTRPICSAEQPTLIDSIIKYTHHITRRNLDKV